MKELHFDEVTDGNLAAGEYDLEVTGCKESESANGNDCLDVMFKEVNNAGRHFERFPLVPQALWKLKRFCVAAGIDVSGSVDVADLQQDLVGCCVHAVIEIQEYQGEDRSRVKVFTKIA